MTGNPHRSQPTLHAVQPMRLAFACDAAFAMPLTTALRSVIDHCDSRVAFDAYLLCEGFSDSLRRAVRDSLPAGRCTLHWVPVDLSPFSRFSTLSYISKATYARLLLPEVLPQKVDRLLYLDADLLVLDDLRDLWECDLGDAPVAAVLDLIDPGLKLGSHPWQGVPRVKDYFNAGVLLIDLDRWRGEQVAERALDYLRAHPHTPFSDQDALNVVFDGCWKRLDARWNFQDHSATRLLRLPPEKRPAIAHFVGGLKPWKATSMNPNARLYDEFRRRTRFARTPAQRAGDLVQRDWYRLKRALRRYRVLEAIWRKLRPRFEAEGLHR